MSKHHDRILGVLQNVTYKDWTIAVVSEDSGHHWLQWSFKAKCSINGEVQHWTSRKWKLSVHMTEGELVQTAFAAALQAEEHECRENFKYQGIAPFNPHIAFSAIMAAAHYIEGRK